MFGNPPLGTQFMTANPNSGLDWPVRLLVIQDNAGAVWTVYTDFAWIAARHGIVNRTRAIQDGVDGDRLDHVEREVLTTRYRGIAHRYRLQSVPAFPRNTRSLHHRITARLE